MSPGRTTTGRVRRQSTLAAAWADVLGIPKDKIGRRDHFFDLGGTSLSAVKLVISLERAVSLKDLTGHPILADLATLIDDRSVKKSERAKRVSPRERNGDPGVPASERVGGTAGAEPPRPSMSSTG